MTAQIKSAFDAASALLTSAKTAASDEAAYMLTAQAIDTVAAARAELLKAIDVGNLQKVIDAATSAAVAGVAAPAVGVATVNGLA